MNDAVRQEITDRIRKDVLPVREKVDSAVKKADELAAEANVTKKAQAETAQAVTEAKQGANDAMSRAKSAWDVATNAKSAVTDFDPLLEQAQSDAKAAGSSAAVLRADMDKVTSLVNDPKTGLNVTYQTAAGNATTISNVKSDVAQLEMTATGLTSRVGNLESKSVTQQTELDQTKAAIALKAEQTDVDTLKGNVTGLQAESTTQANEIKNKLTRSDVTGMLTGYATQEYAQGLVTLKADEWNLNLTKLKTDVDTLKTTGGGVNLVKDSEKEFAGKAYNFHTYNLASLTELMPGKTYTMSFSAKVDDKAVNCKQGLFVDIYNSSRNFYAVANVPISTDYQWITHTFTVPEDKTGVYHITAYLFHPVINGKLDSSADKSDVAGTGYIKEFMLEEGTVAHTWSPAPSDMATVTSVTNLSATVDGIKGLVETKADQSEVTQLSDLVQTKVSSGDFTSTTTQLKNLINQRVQVGDVISQINQEAGGNTLIQVSDGKGSLILDAGNTIITGKAWIPSASIANLTADQVQAGTLSGSKVHAGDNSGNAIDMGGLSDNYVGLHAYANNGDHTYIDLNGIHNYGASYDTRIQQGKITTDYLTVNGGGMIDFRSGDAGVTMDNQDIKFYNSSVVNGGISFAGSNPIADRNSGSGNELRLRYDGSFALTPISDDSTRLVASTKAMGLGYQQTGSTSPDVKLTGLWVNNSGRYVRLGSWSPSSKWSRAEFNSDGVNINHAGLSIGLNNNLIHMYMDGNYAATAIQLKVDGWTWINGYCEAMGFTQHSTLSTKTRIEKADPDHMLYLVNNTDLLTFAFKSEVAEGTEVRHIGPIIDNVNDVAQYRTPAEFIAPTKTARDDDNMIGALFGAVQALTKRIKTLEEKIK